MNWPTLWRQFTMIMFDDNDDHHHIIINDNDIIIIKLNKKRELKLQNIKNKKNYKDLFIYCNKILLLFTKYKGKTTLFP